MTPPTTAEAAARRLRRLPAPAKLNLGLRIRGRRPDGYHEIESLFVPLDLADEVEVAEIEPPGGATPPLVQLEVAGEAAAGVPADGTNLAARAARRFLEAAGARVAVRVRVEKHVPAAAGLGGGSSDAAAVLRGLAELLPGALDGSRLPALALELGADVPFFLDPRPARVTGIGERVEPVPGWPALDLVVARPPDALSTAAVYRAFDARSGALTLRGADYRMPLPPEVFAPPSAVSEAAFARLLENDLEPVATELCPAIAEVRTRVRASGALAAGMSGSGPTVFGIFGDRVGAREAAGRLGRRQAGREAGPAGPAMWVRAVRSAASA